MSKHKRHDDEELLRRLKDEAPEILGANLNFDLDEALKTLISVDPDRVGLTRKRRRKSKSKAEQNPNSKGKR